MISEFLFLVCFLPFLVFSSVRIIIKSWKNLIYGVRFYPFAIQARFWLIEKLYGKDEREEYKIQFDDERNWQLWAIVGIISGIISLVIYVFLGFYLFRVFSSQI